MQMNVSKEEFQDRLQEAEWEAEYWKTRAEFFKAQVGLLEGVVFGLREGGYIPYAEREVE